MLTFLRTTTFLAIAQSQTNTSSSPTTFPVSIQVDAAKSIGELKPIWRMFGADEPNYTTMPNGRKLTAELGALKPGVADLRCRNNRYAELGIRVIFSSSG